MNGERRKRLFIDPDRDSRPIYYFTLPALGSSPDQIAEALQKAVAACKDMGITRLALAGGVASNKLLRRDIERRGKKAGLDVFMPPAVLCTDNAAMIGSAAFYQLMKGSVAALDLNAIPALGLM